jgi:hypothetical protein
MSMEHIVKGTYGQTIEITIQQDGTTQDISSYTTTKQIILKAPSNKIVTLTAAFKTDGTDGIVTASLEDGNIDEAGEWEIQARLANTTADIRSVSTTFSVAENLSDT